MTSRLQIGCLAVAISLGAGATAKSDTVQLVNGDAIRGKVVRLDEKQLVFRSETFGELTIARDKIELIALGNKPLPSAHQAAAAPPASAGTGGLIGQIAPLLQTPAAQQQLDPMVEQLLKAGGLGDLQKNVNNARKGLQDLKKDFGPGPESQVLDSYINLFNLLSPSSPGPAPAPSAQKPEKTPHSPAAPPRSKAPQATHPGP
jgi:hypothetical protein